MFTKVISNFVKTGIKKTANQKQKQAIFKSYVDKRMNYIDSLYNRAIKEVKNDPKAIKEFKTTRKKIVTDLYNNASNYAHRMSRHENFRKDPISKESLARSGDLQRAITRVNAKGKFVSKIDPIAKPKINLVQTRGTLEAVFRAKKTAKVNFKKGDIISESKIKSLLAKEFKKQDKVRPVTSADVKKYKSQVISKLDKTKQDYKKGAKEVRQGVRDLGSPIKPKNVDADSVDSIIYRRAKEGVNREFLNTLNKNIKLSQDTKNFNTILQVSDAQTKKDLRTIRNLVKRPKPTKDQALDYKAKYLLAKETNIAKRFAKSEPGRRTAKQLAGKMKVGERQVTQAFINKLKRNFIKASTIAATTLPPVTIALNVKAKKEDS